MTVVSASADATRDLDQIWTFIATDNLDAADRFLDHAWKLCPSYANQPMLGEMRSEPGQEIRCFSVGSYVAFYRPSASNLSVCFTAQETFTGCELINFYVPLSQWHGIALRRKRIMTDFRV